MLALDQKLGPYRIIERIGSGGMGEVYRAADPRMSREVAIKILPEAFASDPDLQRRFDVEVRSAGALNHPNILAVYDTGKEGDVHYLVSELLRGETLRQRLSAGPLPVRRCIEIAGQIAMGLDAAHGKGIVHRDLKPDNVFLTDDGQVKILDFGLARVLAPPKLVAQSQIETTPATEPGAILGTVGYMSPEQVTGGTADERSDIFSFGVILYEMLTGRRPFQRDSALATLHAIANEDPPELSTIAANVPPALERIVGHCLDKRPERRFQSARDVAFSIEAISVTSQTSIPPVAPRRRWVRSVAVMAVTIALTAAVTGWLVARRRREPPAQTFPAFHRVTYQPGYVDWAAFAPDEQTVLFTRVTRGPVMQTFSVMASRPEARSLGLDGLRVLDVSRHGELALQMNSLNRDGANIGTLATAPLGGGSPRPIAHEVLWADWAPDGRQLALVRAVSNGKGVRLEYPLGKQLYWNPGWIASPRFSPDGKWIAFIVHPEPPSGMGRVGIRNVAAATTRLIETRWDDLRGLAWSPRGDEIWVAASPDSSNRALYAVNPATGANRILLRVAGSLRLADVSADGRALVIDSGDERIGIKAIAGDPPAERDYSWLEASMVRDVSADGKLILFDEVGENASIYVRNVDGSPPVRLGKGTSCSIAPDGQSIVALTVTSPRQLVRIPIGVGQPEQLTRDALDHVSGTILPGAKQIVFAAREAGRGIRYYVSNIDGTNRRVISPEGLTEYHRVSRAGDRIATKDLAKRESLILYVDGRPPSTVPGLRPSERIVGWTADDRGIYVADMAAVPTPVDVIDLASGVRRSWRSIQTDAAVTTISTPLVSGGTCAYWYWQNPTVLYSTDPLAHADSKDLR